MAELSTTDPPAEIHPVPIRKSDIEEHQVNRRPGQHCSGDREIRRSFDLIGLLFESELESS